MAIHALSVAAILAVAWQAVRFAMGDIGNVTLPVFELFDPVSYTHLDVYKRQL